MGPRFFEWPEINGFHWGEISHRKKWSCYNPILITIVFGPISYGIFPLSHPHNAMAISTLPPPPETAGRNDLFSTETRGAYEGIKEGD